MSLLAIFKHFMSLHESCEVLWASQSNCGACLHQGWQHTGSRRAGCWPSRQDEAVMSEGEAKKWLKEELGRGICPQGNFFQPAMSQHSHCMAAAVLTTGTALMTRGPQHMQWLPSTGRQQWDSARGKHRDEDIRTPKQMGDRAHGKAAEICQPDDSGVVGTEGILCGYQLVCMMCWLQPQAWFPPEIF